MSKPLNRTIEKDLGELNTGSGLGKAKMISETKRGSLRGQRRCCQKVNDQRGDSH